MIRPRRDGWQVIVYTGIDPVTGRQRQVSRQVNGSRKQAEREETKLKAEVLAGRHRGTAAKTLGEMVDVYLDWREQNGKPISPRTIQGYRALTEARIKPGIGKLRLPQVDPPALDRFYTALRKSGSSRKPGEPLSGSRLRDVHAVISGALGLQVERMTGSRLRWASTIILAVDPAMHGGGVVAEQAGDLGYGQALLREQDHQQAAGDAVGAMQQAQPHTITSWDPI